MAKNRTIPCALTIAGSDSGGGAGIQADLKVFAAYGAHGASAITCITAQNPKAVTGIQACNPAIVRGQIEAVCSELHPAAAKTGMLYSREIIEVVRHWAKASRVPLVVDPVMVSTSGARLLKPAAISAMRALLPLSVLVTPNLDEAEILAGIKIREIEDLRTAARRIFDEYGCAALVKGGHLRNSREAIDIFTDGEEELLLAAPFVKGVSTHGTGCTYSAAVTAGLAIGLSLRGSVVRAKEYITQAIEAHQRTARHSVLNCFWNWQ